MKEAQLRLTGRGNCANKVGIAEFTRLNRVTFFIHTLTGAQLGVHNSWGCVNSVKKVSHGVSRSVPYNTEPRHISGRPLSPGTSGC